MPPSAFFGFRRGSLLQQERTAQLETPVTAYRFTAALHSPSSQFHGPGIATATEAPDPQLPVSDAPAQHRPTLGTPGTGVPTHGPGS